MAHARRGLYFQCSVKDAVTIDKGTEGSLLPGRAHCFDFKATASAASVFWPREVHHLSSVSLRRLAGPMTT